MYVKGVSCNRTYFRSIKERAGTAGGVGCDKNVRHFPTKDSRRKQEVSEWVAYVSTCNYVLSVYERRCLPEHKDREKDGVVRTVGCPLG